METKEVLAWIFEMAKSVGVLIFKGETKRPKNAKIIYSMCHNVVLWTHPRDVCRSRRQIYSLFSLPLLIFSSRSSFSSPSSLSKSPTHPQNFSQGHQIGTKRNLELTSGRARLERTPRERKAMSPHLLDLKKANTQEKAKIKAAWARRAEKSASKRQKDRRCFSIKYVSFPFGVHASV